MAPLRMIAALLFGGLLYYAVVVHVGGVLAAVAIPRQYFEYFGRENGGAALALMFLGTWSLPVALLVAYGSMLGLRLVGGNWRAASLAVFVGMFVCFLSWQWASASAVVNADEKILVPPLSAFFGTLAAPWFAMPNLLAPWLGLGFGVWLYRSRLQRLQHAGA